MDYLVFDASQGDDGVTTFEALASTRAEQHDAVLGEVRRVLDWAGEHFPRTHGPVDEGMDWDHDLLDVVEPGGWHAVTLTLTASDRFAQAFVDAFGAAGD